MLHLRLLSDLHFEFHRDGGASFVAAQDATDIDCLILAGDITTHKRLPEVLGWFAKKFKNVVYVPGNHDHWGTTRSLLATGIQQACQAHSNLFALDRSVVEVAGHRILGTTLWFPETVEAKRYAGQWNDFHRIPNLDEWVYREHKKDLTFLRRELHEGDIVVSHYLPGWQSVAPIFQGSELNCYFVSDVSDLIGKKKPALWCHGHTHASLDYQLGSTRVVCNPFGYAGHELNPDFVEQLIVQVI